jgi:hypothetical protein
MAAVGGVDGGVVVVPLAGDTCRSRRRGGVAVLAGRSAGGWAALAGTVRVGARSVGEPDTGTGGRVCRVRVKRVTLFFSRNALQIAIFGTS